MTPGIRHLTTLNHQVVNGVFAKTIAGRQTGVTGTDNDRIYLLVRIRAVPDCQNLIHGNRAIGRVGYDIENRGSFL